MMERGKRCQSFEYRYQFWRNQLRCIMVTSTMYDPMAHGGDRACAKMPVYPGEEPLGQCLVRFWPCFIREIITCSIACAKTVCPIDGPY